MPSVVQMARPYRTEGLLDGMAIHHSIRERLLNEHVLANVPDAVVEICWVSSGSWVAVHITNAQSCLLTDGQE